MKIGFLLAGTALLSGLAPLVTANADTVSGTVTSKSIVVSKEALGKLLDGSPPDAEKAFALPMEKLLAPESGATVTTATLRMNGSKIRIDGIGRDDAYALIDSERGTMQLIRPGKKQYIEVTRDDARTATQGLSGMAAIKDKLAKLPKEQRERAESVMKNLPGGQAKSPTPSVRSLDKTEVINGFRASAYEVKDGDETSIGWVTQDDRELARALKTLEENQERVMAGIVSAHRDARVLLLRYGLPVRVQTLDARGYRVYEISGMQRGPLAADLFTVPAGMAKVTPRDMVSRKVGGAASDQGASCDSPTTPGATPAAKCAATPASATPGTAP